MIARSEKGSGINGYVDMIKNTSLTRKSDSNHLFSEEMSPIRSHGRETSPMSGIISVHTGNPTFTRPVDVKDSTARASNLEGGDDVFVGA